jgi:peroxiredoxin Q/BCP
MRAPNFVLPSDEGKEMSLSSLKGKKVVLYFFPKDDTPGCTTEACGFRDLHGEFEKRGAVILGVSKDSVKRHQNFKKKYDLPFTLLADEAGEVISAYGSWGQKKFMGRTFDGILRTTVLIDPEGKIAKIYPKVSVSEHPGEVLEDLDAI